MESDEAAAEVRYTQDVEVMVDIATRGAYYAFAERLRALRLVILRRTQ